MPARLLIVSFSVCPAPDRHGVGLLNVLKALAPRYAVDVLTLRPPHGELPFVERFMKTRMLRVPVGLGSLGEQVELFRRAIKRQLEGEEYEVVHLRSAWGGRAVLQGVQAPTKVVYEVARSTEGEPRAADAQVAAALAAEEAACLELADLVLVPTEGGRAHLGGQKLVELLPPGVDVDHFDWEPGEAGACVLFAGQLAAGRGVRLLVDAVARVRRRRPVKLLLVGPVDEAFRPELDTAIEAAELGSDVEELGALDHEDMPRVIAQASVCVAPASPDQANRPLAGFPTKLLEYMACRRAVVAPRRPSVMEIVADGEEGLLFEPGDSTDLSRAIGALLDDDALRERLAEAGYRRVRAEHPASATRRRLLEAYSRLLPNTTWAPPSRAAPAIDALPSHPDTTTARRPLPDHPYAPGRAQGDRSGEIIIPTTAQVAIPVLPGEIVIEALDFEEAGEPFDTASVMALLPTKDTDAVAVGTPAGVLDPLIGPVPAADREYAEEETSPRPLRPRKSSG